MTIQLAIRRVLPWISLLAAGVTASVVLQGGFGVPFSAEEKDRWKMSFEDARKPYTDLKYSVHGYVNIKGEVVTVRPTEESTDPKTKKKIPAVVGEVREDYIDKSLGCSAFVSVVLYRMKFGDAKSEDNEAAWVAALRQDIKKGRGWAHQLVGSQIAAYFGLEELETIDSGLIADTAQLKALIGKDLAADQLYLFSVEGEKRVDGSTPGHCGFVRLSKEGSFSQYHFSNHKKLGFDGLAKGDFAKWYDASDYKELNVKLFRVPEPK